MKLRAALQELSLAVDGSVRFKPLVSIYMFALFFHVGVLNYTYNYIFK